MTEVEFLQRLRGLDAKQMDYFIDLLRAHSLLQVQEEQAIAGASPKAPA
ncbi:hypothetical protein RSWS8N_19629 [Cereibacter sphaeroides WS8N]|nr:hypothetical protein RSWS8N_19629 [Cereibacter sphaeroides WS8N]